MKRTLLTGTAAGLLIDNAVAATHIAMASQTGEHWLVVLLLGNAALVAVCAALGYAFGACRQAGVAAAYERRFRALHGDAPMPWRTPVLPRPRTGVGATFDEYMAEAKRVAAYAAGDTPATGRHAAIGGER